MSVRRTNKLKIILDSIILDIIKFYHYCIWILWLAFQYGWKYYSKFFSEINYLIIFLAERSERDMISLFNFVLFCILYAFCVRLRLICKSLRYLLLTGYMPHISYLQLSKTKLYCCLIIEICSIRMLANILNLHLESYKINIKNNIYEGGNELEMIK